MIKLSAMRAIIFSALHSYLNRRKPLAAWLWFIAAALIVWSVVKINAHTSVPDGLFSATLFPRFVVMLYAIMGWTIIVNNLLQQDGVVVLSFYRAYGLLYGPYLRLFGLLLVLV
jgi:hypothetical protein